jgi:uncharacterized protein (TIGR02246 family)
MIVRGDERAVADLLDDYGEALDRRDWTRLEQLFLSTATSEWALETPSSNHGRAQILQFITSAFAALGRTHHQFGNYRVQLDGDRATITCRASNYHALAGDHASEYRTVYGAYRLQALKVDGAWRIEHIRLEAFDTVHGLRDQRPAGVLGAKR